MGTTIDTSQTADTPRVADLRRRVRAAMEVPPQAWDCPARIPDEYMGEPLPVRKARAIALKLSAMPTDLWDGQLFAGSMTLEHPRVHAEWGFPDYMTDAERADAAARGPQHPQRLRPHRARLSAPARARACAASGRTRQAELPRRGRRAASGPSSTRSSIALDGVHRLRGAAGRALRAARPADADAGPRAAELRQMAANLRQAPAGPGADLLAGAAVGLAAAHGLPLAP